MLLTVHRLSELTGVHRETIRKRCGALIPEGVRSPKLESRLALRLIYGADNPLSLDAERARLAHHTANIAALDEEAKRSNLLPRGAVETRWAAMCESIRSRLLKLPPRLAEAVLGHPTQQEIERGAATIIREALAEIARGDSRAG